MGPTCVFCNDSSASASWSLQPENARKMKKKNERRKAKETEKKMYRLLHQQRSALTRYRVQNHIGRTSVFNQFTYGNAVGRSRTPTIISFLALHLSAGRKSANQHEQAYTVCATQQDRLLSLFHFSCERIGETFCFPSVRCSCVAHFHGIFLLVFRSWGKHIHSRNSRIPLVVYMCAYLRAAQRMDWAERIHRANSIRNMFTFTEMHFILCSDCRDKQHSSNAFRDRYKSTESTSSTLNGENVRWSEVLHLKQMNEWEARFWKKLFKETR